ncbi:MAG: HYExAFE family protein [Planctomycetes bacterium]|nr:HYExAFE family protein [Planctomycetota bacterium]
MVHRHIHYEAAFEDYIRSRGWPYIAVDEGKKAIFSGARIKSFDFLVYRPGKTAWLVDVKGRKFPYAGKHGKRYWENWVTQDDLEGLHEWEGVFGDGFEPVFVFVYWVVGQPAFEPSSEIHVFRDEPYAMVWVSATEYAAHARTRSPKWGTLTVPTDEFRKLIRPIHEA